LHFGTLKGAKNSTNVDDDGPGIIYLIKIYNLLTVNGAMKT
jgi:hypothetical protein